MTGVNSRVERRFYGWPTVTIFNDRPIELSQHYPASLTMHYISRNTTRYNYSSPYLTNEKSPYKGACCIVGVYPRLMVVSNMLVMSCDDVHKFTVLTISHTLQNTLAFYKTAEVFPCMPLLAMVIVPASRYTLPVRVNTGANGTGLNSHDNSLWS